jgi:predicted RNase H-like nuclease
LESWKQWAALIAVDSPIIVAEQAGVELARRICVRIGYDVLSPRSSR